MNKIACIDVDHIFYLSLTGEKILDENGEPVKVDGKFTYRERTFEESCKVADDYITNILNVTESDGYIGFFGGSSKYRKEIYPEYKANRKDLEPLKNLTEMKSYLADKWNFEWVNSDVEFMHTSPNRYETDDYVASFINSNDNSFIISPDKDLLSLEGNHYNPRKNEWVYVDQPTAYHNFWVSMIVGDTSDNIKGIPGKGPKYAEQYLQSAEDCTGDVLDAYINHFGEHLGIQEFYKNYMCLKIKNDLNVSGFEPVKWENTTIEEQNYDIT
jgi:5'-3' exonuclease